MFSSEKIGKNARELDRESKKPLLSQHEGILPIVFHGYQNLGTNQGVSLTGSGLPIIHFKPGFEIAFIYSLGSARTDTDIQNGTS